MMKFSQIEIGDLFNTNLSRWVKTSDTEAICVWEGTFKLGEIHHFNDESEIVILWSGK